MRLLQRLPSGTYELTHFDHDDPPPYAILSHTWEEGQEVSYQELIAGAGRDKTGFEKIRFCGERAEADRLQYFWVDTCCIDKTNTGELDTAINYMFRWYQRSSKCYVYLSDVSVEDHDPAAFPIIWADAFRRSRWFTRGWTLQELMAPCSVEFFSREGKRLGSKITLERQIHDITRIPISALRGQDLAEFSVEERMSWVTSRTTSVKEDRAYCLLGIFGVFLPVIRGEGEEHAMRRLKKEIQEQQKEIETEQTSSGSYNTQRLQTTRPSHTIPFRRDPDFVDRCTLLDELKERCSTPAARVALVGVGGVGKSQLAIEHCYRTHEASPGMWVLWAYASSTARLEQSFHDIANRVKIEGRRDSQVNIFRLVHDWMCDTDERWLLVLDNVDDTDFLFDAQATTSKMAAKPLQEYLPYCAHGCVLITTRNKEAALQLVEQRDIMALNPMNALQARTLLTKKLGVQATSSNATELTELATVLEHMPLALVQAAAYISQRAPLCSVAQYLDRFRKSERKRTSLLSYDKDHLRRDREAKNSIITTWQISFEYIQQTRPSAADLLSLMSFFDRQGIPKDVLQTQAEDQEGKVNRKLDEARAGRNGHDKRVQFECNDCDVEEQLGEFEIDVEDQLRNDSADASEDNNSEDNDSEDGTFFEDVTALRNFSFISVSTDGKTFEMHALVQLSMRTWLAANGKLGRYKEQFINKLCMVFPTGEYENWIACQALFAHAKAATGHKPAGASSLVQWATLLYRAAWYAECKGNAGEAEVLATQSLKARKKVLGRDHEDTIWGIAMVANAYSLAGRWEEAEKLEVQVMEIRKTKLGADHPHTLTGMNNLALTYWNQGRWKEAEELQVQVMEIRKRKLGADHPDTLTGVNNLALTYWDQGRWEESEKLEVQVMETLKKKHGADHPHTLSSMSNLASTYRNQGRWEEAEKLDVQVMEIRKTKLGADHPDTLIGMGNLALTYMNQGRWEEAEKLGVQVMEIRKRKLGADHPDTLTGMHNLAFTWKSLAKNAEAMDLMQECVQRRQEVLRANHPDLTSSILVLQQWEGERVNLDDELCDNFKDMRL
ncbi:hypothetical protein DPSP01_012190 [Paraphaeosphaeria sporulosa]